MLRQPEQRVLSAYFDPSFQHYHPSDSALEYAHIDTGLTVCQLTWDKPLDEVEPLPLKECADVEEADAHEAARRLREGFVFVGLVEEWDLSICLFHKLGGDCLFSDFENTRRNLDGYNTTLQGFSDTLDGIYQEAIIFQRNLELYGVSNETCHPARSARGPWELLTSVRSCAWYMRPGWYVLT
ncbi:unnamed protein product [Effrenium voratum]|uniref:Uncharacterized protein n=1 Tax=Effrenium voratum TaxID=2562239 RepID=A0AA36HQK8_9DINO|nr:unnamed protein product [Effrenium voratum]CAJ1426496.1 unnamed protein product [Effrenium voratum]